MNASELASMYNEALAVISAVSIGMAWWRRDTDEEERIIIEANELILEVASDATKRKILEIISDHNRGVTLTVQQLNDLREEVNLLKMGKRRN